MSCKQIKHQEVTDGAGNKKEGGKYPEWKNEAMKKITAKKTECVEDNSM